MLGRRRLTLTRIPRQITCARLESGCLSGMWFHISGPAVFYGGLYGLWNRNNCDCMRDRSDICILNHYREQPQ